MAQRFLAIGSVTIATFNPLPGRRRKQLQQSWRSDEITPPSILSSKSAAFCRHPNDSIPKSQIPNQFVVFNFCAAIITTLDLSK
jgi:hypothetical protein